MSQLDERAIARLMQVAEDRDLAYLQVRVGRSELTIARVPPSELGALDPPAPGRAGVDERDVPREANERPEAQPTPARPLPEEGAPASVDAYDTIDAPMVGAFYRAPAPGRAPFVEVGSTIEIGDTVGLVEAMKVFTAVPATRAGVVSAILAENGSFVEFGQPLMRVEAAQQATGEGGASRG